MFKLSEPRIITRGPYKVVGCYSNYEGDDEGPGWSGADRAFFSRLKEVTNRTDSLVLGFLYRPNQDHPEIPATVKACFVGVEVTDFDHVPDGMATTQFSGGEYAIVESSSDAAGEAAEGVGAAIGFLDSQWMPQHAYKAGDACFAAGDEKAVKPPYIEYVYYKLAKLPA